MDTTDVLTPWAAELQKTLLNTVNMRYLINTCWENNDYTHDWVKPFEIFFPISFPIDDTMPFALLTFHPYLHSSRCAIRICRESYTINMHDISSFGQGEQVNIAKRNFHFAYHDFYLPIALIFSDLWQVIWLCQLQFFCWPTKKLICHTSWVVAGAWEITALYITMTKVRREWGAWETNETLESIEF